MTGEATTDGSFRIFFFSDWRIQPLDLAEAMLESVSPVDLIAYGGDDVVRFVQPMPDLPMPFPAGSETYALTDWVLAGEAAGVMEALEEHFGCKAMHVPDILDPMFHTNGWEFEREWVRFADLVGLFPVEPERNWLSRIAGHARHGVAAVIGNDCEPSHRELLHAPGVRNVHADPAVIGGYGIVGVEGSIYSRNRNKIGYVLHSERDARRHLAAARRSLKVPAERLVVVSHTPPAGCGLDNGIRFGFERLGSDALREFVLEHHPALVLCGHCHSRGGKAAMLGDTLVVNAASDDGNARGARAGVIELVAGEPPRLDWIDPAPHSILFLPRIGPKTSNELADLGITRPAQLFSAPAEVFDQIGFGPKRRARLRAIEQNRAIWLSRPQLPERMLFYDVETGLQSPGSFFAPAPPPDVWMIGVFDGNEMKQWAVPDKDPRARAEMYRAFIDFVSSRPDHVLVSWSGTNFDERAVAEGLSQWWRKGLPRWEAMPKLDLLPAVRKCLALPLYKWSLKDVAQWCGFAGYSGDLDGFEVGLMYEEYCKWQSPLPIEEIARYNLDDVRALAFVAQWAREASVNAEVERVEVVRRYRESVPSPYKGVRFDTRRVGKPWKARMKLRGNELLLGCFATPEEAARAYDTAAMRYLGGSAALNFPEGADAEGREQRLRPHRPRNADLPVRADVDPPELPDTQKAIPQSLARFDGTR